MATRKPSRAAEAARKAGDASDVAPAPRGRSGADVLGRLEQIDPELGPPRANRFAAEIDAGAAAVEPLLARLQEDDPDVRADAAEALGRMKDRRALSPLRALLSDPDGEVRTNAAVALVRIGDEQLFPEVVKALRHADPRVVVGAAVTLGRLGDRRVVPNLVEAFKTENVEVGAAVAWALGQCGDRAALPWLITAVDQGFAVANACEALGRIGDPLAQATLHAALANPSDEVRAYAARALGQLRFRAGSAPRAEDDDGVAPDPRVIPALKGLLKDRSRKVRLCAAISLYELGEALGAASLLDELRAPAG